MADTTTIEVSLETWRRLNERKDRPGESFDDVIAELLELTEGVDRDDRDDRDLDRELEPELEDALEDWEPEGEIRTERARAEARRAVRWLEEQERPRKRGAFVDALAAESGLSDRVWWERAVQPALRYLADRELLEYRPGHHDYRIM